MFYSQSSHQHVSAAIAAIFRVILLKGHKSTNLVCCVVVTPQRKVVNYFRYEFTFYLFWGLWFLFLLLAPAVGDSNFILQLHVLFFHSNHHHDVYQKYKREIIYLNFTYNYLHIASGQDLGYTNVITHTRIYTVCLLIVDKLL